MIYKIHEMLLSLKNHLHLLKDSIFECFCQEYNGLLLFLKKIIFFRTYNDGNFKSWRLKSSSFKTKRRTKLHKKSF